MHIRWDDRSIFKAYMVAVVVLFVLYIIPVILFSFFGLDVPAVFGPVRELGGAVYRGFFLAGVPLVSLFLGALSLGMLNGKERGPRSLPRSLGYLMLGVTLLSLMIWIIDMSMYGG